MAAGPLDTCRPTMKEMEQRIWTRWERLQELVGSLNQAVDASPDSDDLLDVYESAYAEMVHYACPACLEQFLVGGPHDRHPVIDDPRSLGEPTVMLCPPRKHGALYLSEGSAILHRPGLVIVCENCADTKTVLPYDVALNDDHPLVGCSWRAAWAPCNLIMADDGARNIMYYDQTLAEVIASVTGTSDWWDAVVEISNIHARVLVHPVCAQLEDGRDEADPPIASLLEQLAPGFLRLTTERFDAKALCAHANAWLHAAEQMGSSQWAGEILNQVADAIRTEDLCQLQDDIAVDLHIRLSDTQEAVKWLRAMTADTLTLTPEGYYGRFG